MYVRLIAIALLSIGVAFRIGMLSSASGVNPEARDNWASQLPSTTHVQRLRFDPTAEVVVSVGDDGAPGQADRDDNFDGLTDNVAEMGAVGSDDLCLAPWQDGYDAVVSTADSSRFVVISRGEFVIDDADVDLLEVNGLDIAALDLSNDSDPTHKVRYRVSGQTDGKPSTRMIIGGR